MPDGASIMNKGFFLSRDGVALCPLLYLCRAALPRFDASDGTVLDRPRFLATFADQGLALLKFNYQPKAWLEIAARRPDVGQWVALVSTLRDPPSAVGPVLSYRVVQELNCYPNVFTNMSFAVGRRPSRERVFANGAPLINGEGKAVGMFAGDSPLTAQTLRSAWSLDALGGRIAAALKSPGDLPLPIDDKHHSFNPAVLSPEWGLIGQEANPALALKRIRVLIARHPDSRALMAREWETLRMAGADAMTADEFLAATRRIAPPEDASDIEKSAYQFRLGTALYPMPGRADDAEAAFCQAVALAPEVADIAVANLASMCLQRGRAKEGMALYQKAATLVPERIDYIEGLQKAVEAQRDLATSDKLNEWIYQLEGCDQNR